MSNRKQWTMRDGTKIKIKDMDDNHLLNSIALLERRSNQWVYQARAAGESMLCMMQGELAIESIEQGLDQLDDGEVGDKFPIYFDMVEEAGRRGLELKEHAK